MSGEMNDGGGGRGVRYEWPDEEGRGAEERPCSSFGNIMRPWGGSARRHCEKLRGW